jgi:hypothetical protein
MLSRSVPLGLAVVAVVVARPDTYLLTPIQVPLTPSLFPFFQVW